VPVLIGTSGWQYAHWRDCYFSGVAQRRWFEKVLHDFRTVELNVTFYRLPRREVFAGWHARSPADAVITVKASRYLTHIKRLKDPKPSVDMLMERVAPLAEKLGPVLVQLPPDLQAAPEALDDTLAAFPPQVRLAVEPRHASWWTDEVREVLEHRGAALAWADRKGAITPLWRGAGWGYLRFHEGRAPTWPFYERWELTEWAQRIADTYDDGEDVYVYFNNDPGCAALEDAITFAEELRRLGRTVTRVPETRPILDR
jgi:uncharacterized protein YecE (DUF72 family)